MQGDKRLDAVVRGRVQGVGFRQGTIVQAQRLGLTGWVANRSNGSVTVIAEGPRPVLEQFLQWLHAGPSMAYVEGVDVYWADATGEFRYFNMR